MTEESAMDDQRQYTNRCACGWEVTGSEDDVVDATIDHGQRIHNMVATRDQVVTALRASSPADSSADSLAG
jgi:predicted small metal-binding protein